MDEFAIANKGTIKTSKPTTAKDEARKVMDLYKEAQDAFNEAQWRLRDAQRNMLSYAMKNGMEHCLTVNTRRFGKITESL